MSGIGDFYWLVIMIGIGDFYWLTAVSLVGSDRVSSLRGTTGLPGTRPPPDADVAKNQQKRQPEKNIAIIAKAALHRFFVFRRVYVSDISLLSCPFSPVCLCALSVKIAIRYYWPTLWKLVKFGKSGSPCANSDQAYLGGILYFLKSQWSGAFYVPMMMLLVTVW